MNFCDFCPCPRCKNGEKDLQHAKTSSGKWICAICWEYDECVTAKRKEGDRGGPCENSNCKHRPRLISSWKNFNEVPKVQKRK